MPLDDDSNPIHMMITIAVVEDNLLIAQLLSEVLGDEGYTVRIFGDGHNALAEITAHPPDLVLLDLQLPLVSGEEVLIRLRHQLGTAFPIIIMTASRQWQPWLSRSATAFLAKPFDLHILLACVAQYVAPHESSTP